MLVLEVFEFEFVFHACQKSLNYNYNKTTIYKLQYHG